MSETTEQATAAAQRHIIERPRLTRPLDETSARVITLVAPAGYGKTTLARQWLASRPHAWLQATESSSDVVALAVHLAKTLATLGLGTSRDLLERVRTMRDAREELPSIAELQATSLRSWPEGSWLAIDDYEYIARSAVAEEYVRLLLNAVDIRLVVASRVNPAWATPRARLYGDIYVVERADLAMQVPETRAVLQAASENHVSQILSLAEGWPALIGLASLADLTAESAARLPSTLFDYFADELFHRGSRPLQVALPQLALAPSISHDLAASMFGPRKGPELLRQAEDIGFFSARSQDLRLHPLLRRFLLTKMDTKEQDAAANSLIDYFLARSDWDDAFELIRQHRKPAELIRLCEAAYASMLSSGRTTTLETWLRLATELGTTSPALDLIRAELVLREGSLSHAKRLALRVINAEEAQEYWSRAWIVAGRAAHLDSCESDALSSFQSAIASARTDEERHDALWGCLSSAEAYADDGDLEAVLDQFLSRQPASAEDVLRGANARMMVASATGGLGEALEFALEALAALDHAHDPLIMTSFVNNLSRSLSLQARYLEAGSLADRLVADAKHAKLDFALPHAYVAKAVALIGSCNYPEAETMLKQAERLADGLGDHHNVLDAKNVQAKRLIAIRDFSRAVRLLANLDTTNVAKTMSAEFLATQGLGHACVGQAARANDCLVRAESLSSFPEITSLVACARGVLRLRQTSDPSQAVEELDVALELSVLDPVVIVCRALPELSKAMATRNGLSRSLGEVLKKGQLPNQPVATGLLTRREKEVLKLISNGYTNREISDELFIAEVTAKVHVRNIIRKLGVRSRTEAAIAALRGFES